MLINKILLAVLIIFCSGCASKYSSIKTNGSETYTKRYDKLELVYNIVSGSGNNRYLKKAKNKDISLISLTIINTSNDTLSITRENLKVYSDYKTLEIMNSRNIFQQLKQKKGWYFLYFLPGLFVIDGKVRYYPLLAPIGIYNFFVAKKANNNFQQEFINNNILGKTILPYNTENGWLGVKNINIENFTIRYIQ